MEKLNSTELRKACRELWQTTFRDEKDFLDLYFKRRFKPSRTFYRMNAQQLASQMQVFNYSINYYGHKLTAGYISGLCTRKDARNKGFASELIEEAHHDLQRCGVKIVLLIPASQELYNFYRRRCYAVCSRRSIVHCKANSALSDGQRAAVVDILGPEHESFLGQWLGKRSSGIMHSYTDLECAASVVRMSDGEVWELRDEKNKLQAMAFWEKQENRAHILDQFGEPIQRKRLLTVIRKSVQTKNLNAFEHIYDKTKGKPYCMARVVNIKKLLNIYASAHPDFADRFYITDDYSLPHNKGFYIIENGSCRYHKIGSYGQYLADKSEIKFRKRSVSEVTAMLFKEQPLQISLMMD